MSEIQRSGKVQRGSKVQNLGKTGQFRNCLAKSSVEDEGK